MPQSPTAIPSVISVENTNKIIPLVKFSREIFFFFARFAVCKTVSVWFFYFRQSYRRNGELPMIDIPSVMLSVRILPTNCVPYTNKMNPSIKLFNGVVVYN
jgi:hypothetical protein